VDDQGARSGALVVIALDGWVGTVVLKLTSKASRCCVRSKLDMYGRSGRRMR
jgi:hypothetical protein